MLNDFRFKNTLIIKKKNHQVCIYCKKEDDSSLASEKADFLDSLDGVWLESRQVHALQTKQMLLSGGECDLIRWKCMEESV